MEKLYSILSDKRVIFGFAFVVGIIFIASLLSSKKTEERIVKKYEQQLLLLREEHEQNIKKVTETYSASLKETKDRLLESEKKVASLTLEVRNLKSRQKTARFKIVHPDGTVEEKEFTETQTEESNKMIRSIKEQFNVKVAEIEQKWSDIHRERVVEIKREFERKELEYKNQIASLEREKRTIVGEKKFGLELGTLTDKTYYGHGTVDIMGSMFLGVHSEFGLNNKLGVGLGIRF